MTQTHALVIDDNRQNLRVLVKMLAKQSVRCTEVNDPTRLLEILPELNAVDVVFLDLEMPGLDGYSVKSLLKSRLGDVRVIAYTVHISEINLTRSMGFDGFLGKPLDNERFPSQWARILQGEPVWERV